MDSSKRAKKCALCAKPVEEPSHRPFCSERCQLADLGSWLDGGYAIAGEPTYGEQ